MIKWRMYIDVRAPEGVATESLYPVALEQARWADGRGLTEIWLDEHHGSEEVSSPLVLAGGLGAVTRRARICVGCLLLPLLDPVRLAEDVILADLLSEGRMEVVAGLGYVRHEFDMFGVDLADRGRLADEKLPVLLACLAGHPFEYEGRRGRVLPRPVQKPRPPVLVGGGVAASARRAARLGDGFAPTVADEEVFAVYREECKHLGHPPGPIVLPNDPHFVHVTDDPERAWAQLGALCQFEINQYGRWAAEAQSPRIGYTPAPEPIEDLATIRQMPHFAIVTPEDCITLARRLPEGAALQFKPLKSLHDTDLGWASLELFVSKVLPQLDIAPPAPAAPVG